ncbi:DUF5132 domain-containing protein [Streptomyces sp. AM 2-1-1]|uniref:DUF5132 domain-containing protein n=1 Tax=Streptomyces sp. AM 2-1-1 TaxID=3028709 RepID=UPI0023B9718D|nr:DUF5132 domain-containing protein [Streptomyces sp. AM 2-1-1]WEH38312.1 DUF5132 domain-containing protein [Streptomyces sp. AM 2-1-1]
MLPVVPPFLVGLIVAPVAKRLLKPLVSGVVRTSVGIAMEVRKAAQEAGENIHDLAAEVAADVVAAQIAASDTGGHSVVGQRAAGSGTKDGAAEGETRTPKIRGTAGSAAGKAH